eukprot:3871601-Alexandrium_andersonii.AAC.1
MARHLHTLEAPPEFRDGQKRHTALSASASEKRGSDVCRFGAAERAALAVGRAGTTTSQRGLGQNMSLRPEGP